MANGNAVLKASVDDMPIETGLATDTWYLLEAQFDATTDKVRARVDGGAWTAWFDFVNPASAANILTLQGGGNAAGGTKYFDDLTISNTACVP